MRNPKRIPELMNRLQKVWEANPDLRLGQLINNVYWNYDIYHLEDEQIISALEGFYAESK